MINTENNTIMLIGKTYRNDNDSISLIIPSEFAKKLDIENSKVLIYLLENDYGDRYSNNSIFFMVVSSLTGIILILQFFIATESGIHLLLTDII
jgi:hypothetical protein